ncbi:TonB-dependent receptor [Massilia solisilvae]|uniref:TonB-dependent receptor n=1 Tax=Massilia solisilvae TaxID=1811225 RepID=A0ABT2BHS5_9BURK|nr:TonB-dependent receptor [Massilia solisilvae]MCS0608002.1 TonB-dependent receptor [Massilia solisilvae]
MSKHHTAPSLLVLGLIGSLGLNASAQTQQPAADDGAQMQSVVVTGTFSKNRRTLDSQSPVDVIGARELQATGSTELATVLGRILPSVNFPRPSGADASDAVRPAQLRGLSPDQVLVLVNGKRRHASSVINVNGTLGRGSAPVDLNAIPLEAIDHIEVLRDGAAAQYGSDAIAGVINIILKKGAKGGDVEAGWGQYQQHDGRQVTLRGSTGFELGDRGWVRIALEAADKDPTNRAGADFRNPREPRYGQVTQRLGDPESRPRTLFVNSQVRVNDDIEWYGFANYGERTTSAAATWRTAYVGTALRSPTIYPEGFLPLEDSTSTDRSVVTGLRGELAGWRWDGSLNYGSNAFSLDLDNTINQSLGASSPTHFYAGRLKFDQTLANLDVAREIPVSFLHGPLTVALGLEARHESYEIGAGEEASYTGSGSQGFSGFRLTDAGKNGRSNQSAYLNLEADVTDKLAGSVAVRHEHYTDFGDTTSAKASARYAVTPDFSVRGTASSGFRAPSLAQQYYTITTTNFFVINGVNTPIETGTFAVTNPAAQVLGAQPLKAEKARNLSLGLQYQPSKNFSTSVDLYRIDIDDRILFSANLPLPDPLKAQMASRGYYIGAARYFTNALDTRTKGVDVVSTYRLPLSQGARVDFTLGYNWNQNAVRHVADNPALLTQNKLLLVDRQTINRVTVASPKDKLSLSTDYTRGAWNARAVVTRYGSFTVPQNDATLDQTYDPQWVLDLSGSVKIDRNWRLAAGIDNVTDRYPAEITSKANLNNNGISRYSGFAPNGFNGRFYYVKAGYSW